MAPPNNERLPLGQQMLRGAGIWQAIIALPICLWLGWEAFYAILEPTGLGIYYFIRDSVNAILAAGIIFSVYVQRKARASLYQHLLFEGAKSVAATVVWIWFLCDSAWGPWIEHCRRYYYNAPCNPVARVVEAVVAGIVLLVLFYPVLAYSYVVWKKESEKGEDEEEEVAGEGEETERTRLLG